MTDSDRQQRPAVWLASAQSIYTHINITHGAQLIQMKRLHAIFLLLVKTEFVTVGQYLSWKVIQMVKIIIFKNPIFRFYALNLDDVEWNVHGCVIYKSQKKHFQILEGEEWFCAGSDVILLPEFWQTHTPFCSVCERVNDERIQSDSRSDTWHTNTHTHIAADKMRTTYRRENHPHDAKMDRTTADE